MCEMVPWPILFGDGVTTVFPEVFAPTLDVSNSFMV
jgi:hypothetical protein